MHLCVVLSQLGKRYDKKVMRRFQVNSSKENPHKKVEDSWRNSDEKLTKYRYINYEYIMGNEAVS